MGDDYVTRIQNLQKEIEELSFTSPGDTEIFAQKKALLDHYHKLYENRRELAKLHAQIEELERERRELSVVANIGNPTPEQIKRRKYLPSRLWKLRKKRDHILSGGTELPGYKIDRSTENDVSYNREQLHKFDIEHIGKTLSYNESLTRQRLYKRYKNSMKRARRDGDAVDDDTEEQIKHEQTIIELLERELEALERTTLNDSRRSNLKQRILRRKQKIKKLKKPGDDKKPKTKRKKKSHKKHTLTTPISTLFATVDPSTVVAPPEPDEDLFKLLDSLK